METCLWYENFYLIIVDFLIYKFFNKEWRRIQEMRARFSNYCSVPKLVNPQEKTVDELKAETCIKILRYVIKESAKATEAHMTKLVDENKRHSGDICIKVFTKILDVFLESILVSNQPIKKSTFPVNFYIKKLFILNVCFLKDKKRLLAQKIKMSLSRYEIGLLAFLVTFDTNYVHEVHVLK